MKDKIGQVMPMKVILYKIIFYLSIFELKTLLKREINYLKKMK